MTPNQPQAFISSYAPRLRQYGNSLLTPVIPQTIPTVPSARTTKRGTIAKNYAEDEYDDDDIFEDGETSRRHTGLRSRREDPGHGKEAIADKIGKEIHEPVEVQGIWRDWMGKLRIVRTDKQHHAQTNLPLTLIPIRLDIDIPSYIPQPALPLPPNAHELGINAALPQYRVPEATPAYRLKDIFLWNLHETLITPDQFANILIHDLDLPASPKIVTDISSQIRSQLEEYAGVALHPLFHTTKSTTTTNGNIPKASQPSSTLPQPSTPSPAPQHTNGINGHSTPKPDITAHARAPPPQPQPRPQSQPPINNELDPDDMYRCIVTLNINLQNKLYTDKFEWSLLHPVGLAERFARHTCADLGLAGEWVPAMAHAIYEAVLRLKKEACETGGMLYGGGIGGVELENMAVDLRGEGAGAGWRYDPENLCEEWEPSLETLSKEEIEKREGDRERQLRRLRRETARFSSTSQMVGSETAGGYGNGGGGGGAGGGAGAGAEEETQLGRGERSKKKRRFRSLSPVGRATPEVVGNAGYGGGGVGLLNEWFVFYPPIVCWLHYERVNGY
ncbi:uncharacterized protein KY384_002264 [Bacidia gigantensis]|uniref:uncharacterized protein n=1 Tax=Bacidia gigantensis TaxID=2732470 RepID=UPI001D046771|nr:uncharacterized protein KY384_002264 [Bacidia gigantensis]KAG8533481.1 hypothetical protein KY384_002264 [Bacidia gigantensis]